MPQPLPIVLGIDPGARQIGVAVLCGEELLFYGVKSFKKRTEDDTLRKLRKIIDKIVIAYRVESVALEKIVYVQQNRSFVKNVYKEIQDFLENREIPVFEYNPKLIRQIICRSEKATKRNTALRLSQKYNELVRYFSVPKPWQKRYYALLFDAIAAGLVCAQDLKDKQQNLIK